jgi:hypothetical protein
MLNDINVGWYVEESIDLIVALSAIRGLHRREPRRAI